MSEDAKDPFANFPGGNPFGAGNPFGKDPFGNMEEWMRSMGIDPREFRDLVDEMQRSLQDAFKNLGQDPSKGFVSGFNVRMGPDGKPHFSTFGNKPSVGREGAVPIVNADQREPLTDVIDEGGHVAITMELPGVEKKDIDVNMTAEHLEIAVENESRKYHKRVRLPAKVDPATTKATYNNGILDVTVKKLDSAEEGVRVPVD